MTNLDRSQQAATGTGRRSFLSTSAAGLAATAAAPAILKAAPSDRVRVAVIGCGGQGKHHVSSVLSLAEHNVELVAVCDVDQSRLAEAKKIAPKAEVVSDLRRVLENPEIDAVTIATPDHWHATAGLLAVNAGKHAYIEKPVCHNIREGRLLLDAARKHKRVVQHGTQSRSSEGIRNAVQMLRDGLIGDVLIAKSWNWQRRRNIGHAQPTDPPGNLDYDLWVGPAEYQPYQANRLHYNWHWWYGFGCGGFGNDGIHDVDYALWGLGVDTHPSTVAGIGGKYHFDDDQEFPDTQQIAFEYPGEGGVGQKRMLIYEQRLWSTNYPFNVDSGAEFIGTKGKMFLSKRGKIEIQGERNARITQKPEGQIGASVASHQLNWIDCIRNGGTPNADIEIAHRTAAVVHLGNICTRVGRTLQFDPATEQITNDQEASELLTRRYRENHWAVPKQA